MTNDMSFTVEILLKSLGGIALCLCLFFSGGMLLHYLSGGRIQRLTWAALFFYLLLGLCLVVSLYAIIVTRAKTLLLPLPILLWVVSKGLGRIVGSELGVRPVRPATLLIFALAVLATYYLRALVPFLETNPEIVRYSSGDDPFHNGLADYLRIMKIESPMREYLFPERFPASPYHYIDIWNSAFLTQTLHLKPAFFKVLVIDPVCFLILALGCMAYLTKMAAGGLSRWKWLVILIGFVSGSALFFPTFLLNADVFDMALYTKLLIPSALLVGILLLTEESTDSRYFIAMIFVAGLAYVTIFPGLAMFCCIIVYGRKWGGCKREFVKRTVDLAIFAVPVVLFLVWLYALNPAGANDAAGLAVINAQYSIADLKRAINIVVGGSFQLFMYLPLFLLVVADSRLRIKIFREKPYAAPLTLFLILTLCGLMGWALLHRVTTDAVQAFQNLFLPCGIIVVSCTLIYLAGYSNIVAVRVLAFLLFLGSVVININKIDKAAAFNRQELDALVRFTEDQSSPPLFANLRDTSFFSKSSFALKTVVYQPLDILSYVHTPYLNFSLNIPYIRIDEVSTQGSSMRNDINWAPFTYYLKKNGFTEMEPEQAMFRFISDYNIRFLTVPSNVSLHPILQAMVKDSLIMPKAGWTVYKVER